MRHGVKRSRAEIDSERNLIAGGSLQSGVWYAVPGIIRVYLNKFRNMPWCKLVPVRNASKVGGRGAARNGLRCSTLRDRIDHRYAIYVIPQGLFQRHTPTAARASPELCASARGRVSLYRPDKKAPHTALLSSLGRVCSDILSLYYCQYSSV